MPKKFLCGQCGQMHEVVLLCDTMDCNGNSCLTCAGIPAVPQGDWFCRNCTTFPHPEAPPSKTQRFTSPSADYPPKTAAPADSASSLPPVPPLPTPPTLVPPTTATTDAAKTTAGKAAADKAAADKAAADKAAAASSDALTNASLLNLMTKIDTKLDTLNATVTSTQTDLANLASTAATKQDLNNLHDTITNETKTFIAAATTPMQNNINNLTTQMQQLTTRLDTMDPTAASSNSPLHAMVHRQQTVLDRLDPAHRSLSFIGFDDTAPAARFTAIKTFLDTHSPNTPYQSIDTIFKGPYNNRTPTQTTVVLFHSSQVRDSTLKHLTENNLTLSHNGKTLRLAKTQPKQQLTRNYALRKANDLLKTHPHATGKTITINWKLDNSTDRTVTVNHAPAFTQTKSDLTGTFLPPFTDLTIPI